MFKHRQRRVSPPTADASSRLFHGQDREHLGVDVSNRLSGQACQWEISKRTMMFCSIQTYPNLWWNMGFPHHMWTMWCGSIWCFIQTLLVCDCSDWSSLDRVCNMKLFQFHQFDGHVLGKTQCISLSETWLYLPRRVRFIFRGRLLGLGCPDDVAWSRPQATATEVKVKPCRNCESLRCEAMGRVWSCKGLRISSMFGPSSGLERESALSNPFKQFQSIIQWLTNALALKIITYNNHIYGYVIIYILYINYLTTRLCLWF